MPLLIIKVKLLNEAKECIIRVDSTALISRVKDLVALELDVPVEQQKLVYNGRSLSDCDTLLAHHIQDGAKLHLIVKRKAVEPLVSSSQCWDMFSTELRRLLRAHFADPDARDVVSNYSASMDALIASLSLDDIERLASQQLQRATGDEQETKSSSASSSGITQSPRKQ